MSTGERSGSKVRWTHKKSGLTRGGGWWRARLASSLQRNRIDTRMGVIRLRCRHRRLAQRPRSAIGQRRHDRGLKGETGAKPHLSSLCRRGGILYSTCMPGDNGLVLVQHAVQCAWTREQGGKVGTARCLARLGGIGSRRERDVKSHIRCRD